MARKPSDIVQPNLRIREELRRRLEREAKKRGVSLNNEMTFRLERSFEEDASRSLEAIAADMEVNWLRFSERLHALQLEEDLAKALEQTSDPKVASLANAWLKIREGGRR